MPRWLWWSPIVLLTLLLAALGLRAGWIAATISETDVIHAYAQTYLDTRRGLGDVTASKRDCLAVPGQQSRVWLTVLCTAPNGASYSYPVDRFGRKLAPVDLTEPST